MLTGNINIKTFLCVVPTILVVERNDKDGKPKGSLTLLVDWLNANIQLANIEDDIEKPLRKLVKARQIPAHKNFENRFDKAIWQRQNDLMVEIYTAVRNIRLLFANHPKSKQIEIPEYLYDGMHIEIY